jgi:hypothetical protein
MDAPRLAIGLLVGLAALLVAADVPALMPETSGPTRIAAPQVPMGSQHANRSPVVGSAQGAPAAPSVSDDGPRGVQLQIHRTHAELAAAQDEIATLALGRDRTVAELEAAQADLARIKGDLKAARADATSAESARTAADDAATGAESTRERALDPATAAQEAMTSARVRLGDLMEAATAATGVAARVADHVQRTPPGSAAHRSAFVTWQMAAVADRAAHARLAVAKEAGADTFAQVDAAEAALADAEFALTDARSVRRKAERSAREIAASITDLTMRVAAAKTLVDLRTVEAAEAAEALAAATRMASEHTTRLAELEQATSASHMVDGVPAPHEPPNTTGGPP